MPLNYVCGGDAASCQTTLITCFGISKTVLICLLLNFVECDKITIHNLSVMYLVIITYFAAACSGSVLVGF